MNSIELKFRRSAEIAQALRSRHSTGRYFHTTTVFNKNKILAIGVNDYNRSHPLAVKYKKKEVWNDYSPSIHSELSAILKLGLEDCSDLTFFNIRVDKFGNICNSKPCSGCSELLKQIGFKKLYYSTNNLNYAEFVLNNKIT